MRAASEYRARFSRTRSGWSNGVTPTVTGVPVRMYAHRVAADAGPEEKKRLTRMAAELECRREPDAVALVSSFAPVRRTTPPSTGRARQRRGERSTGRMSSRLARTLGSSGGSGGTC